MDLDLPHAAHEHSQILPAWEFHSWTKLPLNKYLAE